MSIDLEQLIAQKKVLIDPENSDWNRVLNLGTRVRNDFQQYGFLNYNTFADIIDWKLMEQVGRAEKIKQASPEPLIQAITQCYLQVQHPDPILDIKIKMNVLLSIPWIGIGIASSLMSLHRPDNYAGLEQNSWNALFQKNKKSLSIKEYLEYLKRVRELAEQMDCEPLAVEFILNQD